MKVNILPVKPFRETPNKSRCGPASLKMVFDYYGIKKTEKEIAEMCRTTKELGTSTESIKRVSESLGFKTEIKNNCTFEDIKYWLNKKVPVIVDWFTRGTSDYTDSDIADGHYSIVVGLNDKFIYLQDPELGKIRKLKRGDFMIVWFDFKGKYIKPDELIIRQIITIHR